MITNTWKRPALGQVALLGSLYDARSDRFLPDSLMYGSLPSEAITRNIIKASDTRFSSSESYRAKFESLGVDGDLGAALLAGMVETSGAGRYLLAQKHDSRGVSRTLYHTVTTVHEKLNFFGGGMRDFVDFSKILSGPATHVVSEITWGAQTVISATCPVVNFNDKTVVEESLRAAFQRFGNTLLPDYPDTSRLDEKHRHDRNFDIKVFADACHNDQTFHDFDSAYRLIVNMPNYVSAMGDGKGKPITYTLLPVSFFSIFYGVELSADLVQRSLNPECQEKFVTLFDDFENALRNLSDYCQKLSQHRFCVPAEHIGLIMKQMNDAKAANLGHRSDYSALVMDIKAGKTEPQQMWQLLDRIQNGSTTPDTIQALTRVYTRKMDFADAVMEKGAKYVGYNNSSPLDVILMKNPSNNASVFYFNEWAMQEDTSWNENLALLHHTLAKRARDVVVVVVDCDITGEQINKTRMSTYENGVLTIKDLLEEQKLLADKCLMRYEEHTIDRTVVNAPSQRRVIRLACPSSNCTNVRCDWICFKCHAPVEFGMVDRFCYCDCGRAHYNDYDFKCKEPHHGTTFEKYPKRKLLQLLENLPPPDELNILILGETGVGKSTFINAFVNYLTFQSLDEGLSAARLNCVISCSFSTQYIDHENGGKLMQKLVKIGSDDDESDGLRGQSATQKTVVYPLYIGHTLVRLIDTPGIGDTRGVEQDQRNMVDVLSVLRNYDRLHGILILLKPNNSRLTVMFRFCVKELLTHLHRSAARNMVFGFTNTRGSNYQPGDTFKPLETLLDEYHDVIPGLFRETVYCYDSESFRYLAARHKGVDMGNIEDYRRSWEHSANEAHRLLNHFRTLPPHYVQATLSLNETRYLIAQLTQPMAEISKSITKSIAMNEEDMKALADKKLTGAELKAKLDLQKMSLNARQLSRPRTVCSNSNCVKVERNNGKEVTLHKAMCHNPCCLTDVPPNSVGTRQLQGCAAFSNGKCRVCNHNWTEHLHIVVEYQENALSMKDPAVEKALKKNATDIQVKEAAIKAKRKLIDELQTEHRKIQEAAAQFSVYLTKNSITPYNDATLEYLDHLIKEEKSKVGFGADPTRLDNLEKDRLQYSEFVKAMTLSIEGGKGYQPLNEEGVYALVSSLYGLQHSGNDLKHVAKVVGTAYAATFREKPYRIRSKNYWMTTTSILPSRMRKNKFGNSGIAIEENFEDDHATSSSSKALRNPLLHGESEKENFPLSAAPPAYSSDPSAAWKAATRRTGHDTDEPDASAWGDVESGIGRGSKTNWFKDKFKHAGSRFRSLR